MPSVSIALTLPTGLHKGRFKEQDGLGSKSDEKLMKFIKCKILD